MEAPPPQDERARVEALRELHIPDTEPEEAYDEIARLASYVCHTPTALITCVDSGRQWFKSRVGFAPRETPREASLCAHAILQPGPLVVTDALDDDRFRDNPLALEDPYIRFNDGFPLNSVEGHRLGTLCVIDGAKRVLFPDQEAALRKLSNVLVALLDARRIGQYLEGALAELEGRLPQRG